MTDVYRQTRLYKVIIEAQEGDSRGYGPNREISDQDIVYVLERGFSFDKPLEAGVYTIGVDYPVCILWNGDYEVSHKVFPFMDSQYTKSEFRARLRDLFIGRFSWNTEIMGEPLSESFNREMDRYTNYSMDISLPVFIRGGLFEIVQQPLLPAGRGFMR